MGVLFVAKNKISSQVARLSAENKWHWAVDLAESMLLSPLLNGEVIGMKSARLTVLWSLVLCLCDWSLALPSQQIGFCLLLFECRQLRVLIWYNLYIHRMRTYKSTKIRLDTTSLGPRGVASTPFCIIPPLWCWCVPMHRHSKNKEDVQRVHVELIPGYTN